MVDLLCGGRPGDGDHAGYGEYPGVEDCAAQPGKEFEGGVAPGQLAPRSQDCTHEAEGEEAIPTIDKNIAGGFQLEEADDGDAAEHPDAGQQAIKKAQLKVN